MILQQIINYLEEVAPRHLQESYDNAGLIYGDRAKEISGAIISLDCTEDVVDEAIAAGYDLIISHHPIVFSGIKQFDLNNYVHRVVVKAIQNDIAIYAIHTNLDNVLENGVNQKIAQKLGLVNLEILRKKSEDSNEIGAGVIGNLQVPHSEEDFLKHIKTSMNLQVMKHTTLLGGSVRRIAVCGGSGGFLLKDAIAQKADFFITADYKYHEFFDANAKVVIADIGHYESEYFTIELLFELLTQKFPKFAARCTKVVTNPIFYY